MHGRGGDVSNRMITLVYSRKFGGMARKAIANKLADIAGDYGEGIYPAVATIARDCETSRRTVQRILKEFVKSGVLEVTKKGGCVTESGEDRRKKPTEYHYNLAKVEALPLVTDDDTSSAADSNEANLDGLPSGDKCAGNAGKNQLPGRHGVTPKTKSRGDTVTPGGVSPCHPGGDTLSPKPSFNPPYNLLPPTPQQAENGSHGGGEDLLNFGFSPKWSAHARSIIASNAKSEKFKPVIENFFAEVAGTLSPDKNVDQAEFTKSALKRLADHSPAVLAKLADDLIRTRKLYLPSVADITAAAEKLTAETAARERSEIAAVEHAKREADREAKRKADAAARPKVELPTVRSGDETWVPWLRQIETKNGRAARDAAEQAGVITVTQLSPQAQFALVMQVGEARA